jgi:hypothetical protein
MPGSRTDPVKIILSFVPSDIPVSPEWFYPAIYNESRPKEIKGNREVKWTDCGPLPFLLPEATQVKIKNFLNDWNNH